MAEPIRVGIVGANAERGWGRDAHLPALKRLPQFQVTAVSARTRDIAETARPLFGARKAFDDSLALARDPDVDLVAVTVKVPEHKAIVLAALAAGKHVYCEWPLGKDVAEAEEMAAAVTPATHVLSGVQGLYAKAVRDAPALLRSGAIGAPLTLSVFSSAGAWGSETTRFNAYLQDKTTGATHETIGGGHTLAAIEAIVGAYREVDARNTTLLKQVPITGTNETVERTCADHMMILGKHSSGCVSTLEVVGGFQTRTALFEVTGESGWLRVSGLTPGTYQIPPLTLEASVPLPPSPEPVAPDLVGPPANVADVYAAFAADIRWGTRTVPDFAHAVRLTRLLAAIDEASATGRRQYVS